MPKDVCQFCGYEDNLGNVKKYSVYPQEIVEQVGEQNSKIARLCSNCQRELERWYSTNIASMTYDSRLKQFRAKSPQEMLKEYEVAYQHFAQYKEAQHKLL